MFGYVMVNHSLLDKEDKDRYQALYCGLCKKLYDSYGLCGRMTLTYDMVFMSMLLSSLYQEDESVDTQKCLVHPFRRHEYICSPATEYVADLSIVLAYYKCLDDWNDDSSIVAKEKSKILKKRVDAAVFRWPRQFYVITNEIKNMNQIEKHNILDPDLPANCFGFLMGELLVREEDEYSETLRKFGAALGRFVYLMDAVNDLRDDLKRKRYNPLVSMMSDDYTEMLTLHISECTSEFERLPLERDITIIRNILYSGVWMKYKRTGKAE